MPPRTEVSLDEMVAWTLAPERQTPRSLLATQHQIADEFGIGRERAREAWDTARRQIRELLSNPKSTTHADLARRNKQLQRELQKREDLVAAITPVITAAVADLLPSAPPRVYDGRTHGKKTAALMGAQLSDIHCGAWVPSHVTHGLGGFDRQTLSERLRYYSEKIVTIAEEWRRVRAIPELVIFGLGDYLEGENIYKGQQWLLDAHLQEQFCWLINELAVWLMELAAHFKRVRLYAVSGNHGRMSGFKGLTPEGSNADTLLMRQLQALATLHPGLSNVDIWVSQTYLCAVEIHGYVHLLRHGQDARRYMQIPWYGMQRNTLKFANLVRLPVSFAHIGHHHKSADWPISVLRVLTNGCFPGPTPYSINELQEADLPTQRVMMLHPEYGVTWSEPLRLAEPEQMVADVAGLFTPAHGPEAGEVARQPVAKRK